MILEMNFYRNRCFVKIIKRIEGIKSIIFISNSVICFLDVGDEPSGDVLVTVSTHFSEKGKDQNSVPCTKKYSLFLVSNGNDNTSRGCATKMEFLEGRGGPFR